VIAAVDRATADVIAATAAVTDAARASRTPRPRATGAFFSLDGGDRRP
jgi:hypothetical protein